MRKMIRWFKTRGFTDRLYIINITMSWLFLIACLIITIFSGKLGITDMSVVTVGVPAVFAETGVYSAFIVKKAETENLSKNGREDLI